jgi:hypothetical protein
MLAVRLRGATSNGNIGSLLVRKDYSSFRAITTTSSCRDEHVVGVHCATASKGTRYGLPVIAPSHNCRNSSVRAHRGRTSRALTTTNVSARVVTAVALPQTWEHPIEEEEEDEEGSSTITSATTSGYTPYTSKFTTTPSNASTTSTTGKPSSSTNTKGGGGGGSRDGRIKCPRCGQNVLFQHADFEENTFYCATCSSWFLVTPSSSSDLPKSTPSPEYQQPLSSTMGYVSLIFYLSSFNSVF